MLEPILIDTGTLLLHPFRAEEIHQFDRLSRDLLSVFSHSQTTEFLPNKRMKHIEQAENMLHAALLNQQTGLSQTFFITNKAKNTTIGMIEVLSPNFAINHYQLDLYPHILEFCLSAAYTGMGIMGRLLPALLCKLREQGIMNIGAVTHRHNLAAANILRKAGLSQLSSFDSYSDLYHNVATTT